jgi:hypothetical protein
MKKLVLMCLALLAMAPDCGPPTGPTPPPVPPPPVPPNTEQCVDACANLKKLKCPEAEPIKMSDGSAVTCEQFCRDTQGQGVYLNPACVATVTTCGEVETKCYVGKAR